MENRKKDAGLGRESAETLSLQALTWLAEDEERINGFLGMSGASVGDMATAATDATFLGAVLDYLLTEDAMVIGFCDARGLPYDAPMKARAALPGGDHWHWT